MGRSRFFPQQAIILTGKELQEMRLACRLAADTLEMIGEHIQPGITTDEINTLVHEYTLKTTQLQRLWATVERARAHHFLKVSAQASTMWFVTEFQTTLF